MNVTRYERSHLPGVQAICAAEDWPSLSENTERAHAVLTAPGVTTVVAVEHDEVVGFAYLQSDGHIQAHLSMLAVRADHRRRGIGRALLEYAAPLTGALRIDLVTDTAGDFYKSLPHRTYQGFRIYPG
ncbi:GCN5-related N-acetyltransferase [Kribbella flavida DSM 17836]|uniref:GCN5-related N-acetyltransferase n=1 Tax=Kribbella flavida (strain DSM 17836 / JCM 10339 / NBRC 14399) TaxID=479435 RepID=D2PXN1_KRIFD|nr:GNAT family N-acetyltransferase [Kribbella flavida]ADB31673.1 GCN5-related N-acetyltransferase [Kribbella flavida DSM 17836]